MLIGILVLLGAFFIYSWFLEPTFLQVQKEKISIDANKLRTEIRILFISDLHIGRFNSLGVLRRHIAKLLVLHQKDPFDLLLMGGDFFDREVRYLNRLPEVLKALAGLKVPMYTVLGNHDYSTFVDPAPLVKALEKGGVKVLENEAALISIKKEKLFLVGLKDLESESSYPSHRRDSGPAEYVAAAGKIDWYEQFDHKHPKAVRILLSHNPDGVYLPGVRPDLVLSGHTHGGQFAWLLPFSRPLMWLMPAGSFITTAGRRLVQGTTLLISRGLAGSIVPARFCIPPSALVITLSPAQLPTNLVIGLAGKPRSGKDTVAGMLATLLPGITKVTFGHAIKEEFDTLHGTNTRHSEAEKIAHRDQINEFGASKRAEDPLYWIKRTLHQPPPLLITDVRQPQEVEAVRQAKGVLIRIQTSNQTLAERMGEHKHLAHHINHVHESHLDEYGDWDYVIENNGSLAALQHAVEAVAKDILNRYQS